MPRVVAALVLLLLAPAAHAARPGCTDARQGCVAAARWTSRVCDRECRRLPDAAAAAACRATCGATRATREADCRAIADPCAASCPAADAACRVGARTCRATALRDHRRCTAACGGQDDVRCRNACDHVRAVAEAGCGFAVAHAVAGEATLPDLPTGRPADLPALLDPAELAVVEAADARAATLRSRPLRLHVGRPGATVAVTQVRHGFRFGFPLDSRRWESTPEKQDFYGRIAQDHARVMVLDSSPKWRNVQPQQPDAFAFDVADRELAWGLARGFEVKGHTLLWGNAPPFSTGTGIPVWLREAYPTVPLTPTERDALRALLRQYVETTVRRYQGRLATWDVTNETLNVFTQWFIDRLGPDIVEDMFAWVHAIDPGAELVMNEWITEVFTGLPGPNAAAFRDRLLALRAKGVPIHAVGQQAHFVPGAVYAGLPADLSVRTRIDDYAVALDTLAEVGLPIHMTETNFVAPADPEGRAAQAEALMRLWWGHPAVDEIVFWGLWNQALARNHLQHGLWADDRTLSRHGEAVVSLLNDRWRTRAELVADADGFVTLRATLGDYVAQWDDGGAPVHAAFTVERGPGAAVVTVARP